MIVFSFFFFSNFTLDKLHHTTVDFKPGLIVMEVNCQFIANGYYLYLFNRVINYFNTCLFYPGINLSLL